MISREKRWFAALSAFTCLLSGCAQEEPPAADPVQIPEEADLSASSYTESFQCTYEMAYSDNTKQTFDLDGVLEVDGEKAHYTQNIYGNGAASVLEGWYYDGRLYNTYNGVTYYEDMTLDQLKSAMVVQLTPYHPPLTAISSTEVSDTRIVYTLTTAAARDLFLNRYDFYGFDKIPDLDVLDGTITHELDNGVITGEKAEFHAALSQSGVDVEILYRSGISFVKAGDTAVSVDEKTKAAHSAYVHYSEIDTEAISDADLSVDAPEDTAEATFRKRLMGRLSYVQTGPDTYKSEFNENESYTVDFANRQFIYTNYSSRYVYNWAGDVGVFGTSCTYELGTGVHSSDCAEDVLEMIETVKLYLRMELYYCGLSLEELQAETQ